MLLFCKGEEVRRYISGPPGPPGPPGAPGRGNGRLSNQEVAERVLNLMSGTSHEMTYILGFVVFRGKSVMGCTLCFFFLFFFPFHQKGV